MWGGAVTREVARKESLPSVSLRSPQVTGVFVEWLVFTFTFVCHVMVNHAARRWRCYTYRNRCFLHLFNTDFSSLEPEEAELYLIYAQSFHLNRTIDVVLIFRKINKGKGKIAKIQILQHEGSLNDKQEKADANHNQKKNGGKDIIQHSCKRVHQQDLMNDGKTMCLPL